MTTIMMMMPQGRPGRFQRGSGGGGGNGSGGGRWRYRGVGWVGEGGGRVEGKGTCHGVEIKVIPCRDASVRLLVSLPRLFMHRPIAPCGSFLINGSLPFGSTCS